MYLPFLGGFWFYLLIVSPRVLKDAVVFPAAVKCLNSEGWESGMDTSFKVCEAVGRHTRWFTKGHTTGQVSLTELCFCLKEQAAGNNKLVYMGHLIHNRRENWTTLHYFPRGGNHPFFHIENLFFCLQRREEQTILKCPFH